MVEDSHHPHLIDTNQSFWNLSTIQLTSLISIPVLATSITLLEESSFLNALATIILSNLILWVLRYAIIKMSYKDRSRDLFRAPFI